jgi:hypothetical protein
MPSIDPNVPGIFFGEVSSVTVTDPALPIPGSVGNLVLDPNQPFTLTVEWNIDGPFAPAMRAAMAPTWQLRILAESQGPGPEAQVVSVGVPTAAGVAVGNKITWTHNQVIAAGTFAEGSLVKVLVVVRDTLPGPVDVAGYFEGPILLFEAP